MIDLPINQIIVGDCLEVMRGWPDGCVDAVITSPPYNLGNNHHTANKRTQAYLDDMPEEKYQDAQIQILNELLRVSCGDLFYNHQHRFRNGKLIRPCGWITKSGWELKQEIVWSRGSPNMDKRRFFPFTERIYWLTHPKSKTSFTNNLNLTDDWHIAPVGASGEHTRQFPYELPARILACIDAKVILDPYLGSGTTAVAAINQGKSYIGIEIEPKYAEIARQRIAKEQAQGKLFT